jgi:large subunit ribosomal protein L10
MSKFVKELLQKEFENLFGDTKEFVVIDTDGVGGNQNNEMRGELSNKGMRLRVVRNSLVRKAMEDLGMPKAKDLFAAGPCTVVFGGDSVVDVAKEVVDWSKKIKAIELKGAYVDGELVVGKGVVDLSKMPNRAELQAQVVQIALTPGSNIAGAVTGPASAIAGCLKTIIDKAEEAA